MAKYNVSQAVYTDLKKVKDKGYESITALMDELSFYSFLGTWVIQGDTILDNQARELAVINYVFNDGSDFEVIVPKWAVISETADENEEYLYIVRKESERYPEYIVLANTEDKAVVDATHFTGLEADALLTLYDGFKTVSVNDTKVPIKEIK